MSIRLRELIKEVRMCKTAAEERAAIAKECSNIRTAIKEDKSDYRHRNVAKLLYIHMLGYPTHFGQMECLKLIVSPSYADKRMGYLGLMLLLDEKQEVLMLVTNSLQTDLNHPNQYIVGLALCSLANISSSGIARDLAPTVIKLMASSNPYIKKKAALCAIRIVRKVPELMENFVPKVRPLLAEHNHGVLITAASLMIELCEMQDANISAFRKTVPTLVKILKNLVQSGYAPEHDVNGITDPFLQVKLLKLMRLIGRGDAQASDVMNDILAQVATNTENSRNVGNSILYECVQTIMSIESEGGLRVLAINILGRFLLNKDNNIRYVALNTLRRVVSADQQAVQRHRATIVECLKDHDISIRRRALDMVYALVNESNIKSLMRELLNYLMSTDYEARNELTAKICWVTEKYAPNPRWHVDTILRVMAISGDQIPEEVVSNTIHLIIETPDLQAYAVQKLFTVLSKEILKQPLVQTGVWCLGEFGDLLIESGNGEIKPQDIISLFDRILRHPSSTSVTKGYVLTAIVKLTDRLKNSGIVDEALAILDQYRTNIVLELQQRACEYYSLIVSTDAEFRAKLLEKVPALDDGAEDDGEEDGQAPAAQSEQAAPQKAEPLLAGLLDTPQASKVPTVSLLDGLLGGAPPAGGGAPSGGSLMELLSTPNPEPAVPITSSGFPGAGVPAPVGIMPVSEPLPSTLISPSVGIAPTPILSSPTPVAPVPATVGAPAPAPGAIPSMVAFEKNGLRITFDFLKKPGDPTVTLIQAVSLNGTPIQLTDYSFQVAVPKYMKIMLQPPSGTVLPPGGRIGQQMMIANSLHGQQPVALKFLLQFTTPQGQRIQEEGTLTSFPPGV